MVDRFNGIRGITRGMSNGGESNSQCASCNTCGNTDSSCRSLCQKLKKIDFSLIDTILYLDAYPECKKALAYYHKLKAEREMIIDMLSKKCNTPITNLNNSSEDSWNWVEQPWPWDPSAN